MQTLIRRWRARYDGRLAAVGAAQLLAEGFVAVAGNWYVAGDFAGPGTGGGSGAGADRVSARAGGIGDQLGNHTGCANPRARARAFDPGAAVDGHPRRA